MIEVTPERIRNIEASIERVSSNVRELGAKLDGVVKSLEIIARMEERHLSINERLTEGSRTMNEIRSKLDKLDRDVPDRLESRLMGLERDHPSLMEGRKWLVGGVLACVTMLAGMMLKLLFLR